MIKLLYNMPNFLKEHNIFIWSLVYKFNKLIINVFYPIVQRFNKKSGISKNNNIIVSLTSYPKRIDIVWLSICSIMNQSIKPSKIILWLSEEEFKDRVLPKKLLNLKKRGLEICFCNDNLKPHKKYYYAMEKYPNDIIITIDDDIIYPEDTIELLYKGYLKHKNTIICNRAHKITYCNDNYQKYNEWSKCDFDVPSMQNIATGIGGVLYPPNSVNKEVFNLKAIKELTLTTDDLWLKFCETMNRVPVTNVNKNYLSFYNILKTNSSGLYVENTKSNNINDVNWNKLCEAYPKVSEVLIEDEKRGN